MDMTAKIDALYEAKMNEARLEGAQRQKQIIALNLLRENFPLEFVSCTTGLSIDRLQQLQSSPNNDR